MSRLRYAVIILAGLLADQTSAQVVQDDWLAPALKDYSTTLTLGENYDIQWTDNLQNWFPQYAASANVSNVALWITTSSSADGQLLISPSVNVNTTTSFPWTVSLTTAQLTISTDWTFRFLPAGSSYTSDAAQQVSSPRVVVQNTASSVVASSTSSAAASTSASSPVSQTAASATGTAASTSTSSSSTGSAASASTSAAQNTPSKSSSSVSGGAIAGIVIGTIAVILIAVGLYFFVFRRKSQLKQQAGPSGPATDFGHPMNDYKYYPQSPQHSELHGSTAVQSQPPYSSPSELEGSRYR